MHSPFHEPFRRLWHQFRPAPSYPNPLSSISPNGGRCRHAAGGKRRPVLPEGLLQTLDHFPAARRHVVDFPAVVGLGKQFRLVAGAEIPGGSADGPLGRRRPRCTADRAARWRLDRARCGITLAAVGECGHVARPTNPAASPRDRPARPGRGFARPRRRHRRAGGASRAREPTRQTGRRRTAPRADARPRESRGPK